MGRINNPELYPVDQVVTREDTVIGSDLDTLTGKTKQYKIGDILDLAETGTGNLTSFMSIRSNQYGSNADEAEDKWYYEHNYPFDLGFRSGNIIVRSPILEIMCTNIANYIDPVLVIKRFRHHRVKGKDKLNRAQRIFRRAGFKEETPSDGTTIKPNRLSLSEGINMIDLSTHLYFSFSAFDDSLGGTMNIKRKGTYFNRKSKNFRLKNDSSKGTTIDNQFISLHIEAKKTESGEYERVSQDYVLSLSASMTSKQYNEDDMLAHINVSYIPNNFYRPTP